MYVFGTFTALIKSVSSGIKSYPHHRRKLKVKNFKYYIKKSKIVYKHVSKLYMKAKARILILLICMVSITGFGYSTPDLIQNSEVVTVSTYDVGIDNVITLNVVTNKQDFIEEQISLKASVYDDLSITKYEALKNSTKSIRTLLSEKVKTPLNRKSKGFYNYKLQGRTNHKDVFIYRRAREGLSS